MAQRTLRDLLDELAKPEEHGLPRNEKGRFYATLEVGKGKPYSTGVLRTIQRSNVVVIRVAKGLYHAWLLHKVALTVSGTEETTWSMPAPVDLSPTARYLFEHSSNLLSAASTKRGFMVHRTDGSKVKLPLPDIEPSSNDADYWNALGEAAMAIPGAVGVGPFEFAEHRTILDLPVGLPLFLAPAPVSRYDF